ncbi:MAG: DUF4402 domain-containing protein [Alphaproteobacteria bacterium]|nr:DUF4402 domain-containing protein [Alphaproteobacteria bacterium]
MRKYFLLSAVALLSANTVIAAEQGEIANMQVTANVSVVSEVNCSTLDFGNIYIRANNKPSSVTVGAYSNSGDNYPIRWDGDVTGATGGKAGRCDLSGIYEGYSVLYPDHVSLTGGFGGPSDDPNSEEAYITNLYAEYVDRHAIDPDMEKYGDSIDVGGTLNIPENFSGGELSGTITITIINEPV